MPLHECRYGNANTERQLGSDTDCPADTKSLRIGFVWGIAEPIALFDHLTLSRGAGEGTKGTAARPILLIANRTVWP